MGYGVFRMEMRTSEIEECWERRHALNAMVKSIERRVGSYNYSRITYKKDPNVWGNHPKVIPSIQVYEVMVCNMTEYQYEIFKDLGYDVEYYKRNMSTGTRKRQGFKRLL